LFTEIPRYVRSPPSTKYPQAFELSHILSIVWKRGSAEWGRWSYTDFNCMYLSSPYVESCTIVCDASQQ